MKKIILSITTILLISLHASGQSKAFEEKLNSIYKNTVALIKAEQLYNELNNDTSIILLDTRELNEYNVSHLINSRHAGYKQFKMRSLNDIPFDTKIIVYCTVGYRSEKIGEKLLKAGYMHVQNLYGGIFQWVNIGYPVYDNANRRTNEVHAYSHEWGVWLLKGDKVYE